MKVEAGTGLEGSGLEQVRVGEQSGVAAGMGELGCGQLGGKGWVERAEGEVCIQ